MTQMMRWSLFMPFFHVVADTALDNTNAIAGSFNDGAFKGLNTNGLMNY